MTLMNVGARHIRRIMLLLWMIVSATGAFANEKPDSTFEKLYHRYLELYSSANREAEFYSASKAMMNYYLNNDNRKSYYKIRLNETLYDTEHNHPYLAIKKANKMLEDMEDEETPYYDMVYTALGTVFESRGNYKMAEYYYNEALKNASNSDESSLIGLYSRLAYLHMLNKPLEAKRWNERYYEPSKRNYPDYYQVNLFISGMIDFALGYEHEFRNIYEEYQNFHKKHEQLDNYGRNIMEVIRKVFDKHYAEALELLSHPSADIDDIHRFDMRIKIYQIMGNNARALQEAQQRAEVVDSLNSDMLFDNLNEVNAQAGITRLQAKAAKSRNTMLTIIILLALVVIAFLIVWGYLRNRVRRNLMEKNEQLNTALKMAEESDNMKTEFVRNVSHEIRTPLNAINGFSEVIVNPDIELSAEERSDLIARIKENTMAITKIVDELLHMSEDNGGNYYPRTGTVYCNQLLSKLLYDYRDEVKSDIELKYTTEVINRFTITTNADGLRKIVDHLVQNAIKFTSRGFIEVHCRMSDDRKKVEISVTDTGKGIGADKRGHIFEQFFKEDSFKQGIGLGLTVSKKIAQKMEGDLVLDESYTDGARFILTLPAE